MKAILFISFLPLCGVVASGADILPLEFPVTRYTSLWEDSPFNREVVAPVATQIKSTLGINLTLEGLVTDETAGPIAYMRDLQENKFLVVTKEKKEGVPFYLVSAEKSNNPSETKVTISDGKETTEIGFAEGVFTKKIETPVASNPTNGEKVGTGNEASNPNAGTNEPTLAPDSADSANAEPKEANTRRRRILLPARAPETSN